MKAGKFLYAWLLQETGVTALVGSGTSARIYPVLAPQDTASPYVTYQVIDSPQLHTLDPGPAGLSHPRVQIDCYAQGMGGYAQVQALSEAIKGTESSIKLNGYRGTLGGVTVQGAHLTSEQDIFEPPQDASDEGWHRVSMDFTIWLEE